MTIAETLQAAEILRAAQTCAKIAYVPFPGPSEKVVYGHARSVGNDSGGFGFEGTDVRDMFLRITTREGWEVFEPMATLMSLVGTGEFTTYDW